MDFDCIQHNEQLAEAVRSYPCLYDKGKIDYKCKNVVANAWRKVAENKKTFLSLILKSKTAPITVMCCFLLRSALLIVQTNFFHVNSFICAVETAITKIN